MKLETLLIVSGLLLLALLADPQESQHPAALVADGTLPPERLPGARRPLAPTLQQAGITLTSIPLGLSMDMMKGL